MTTAIVKWCQFGDDIEDDEQDQTGHSISLSDDGNRLAVAANKYDSGKGRVKVYEYDGTSWNKLGENIDNVVNVSLSGDGNFMVVGDPDKQNDDGDDSAGRVRVFEYNSDNDAWSKIGDNINGEAADDESGRSVSLNYFGSIVAIGAPYNDNDNGDNSGHVKVYEYDSNTAEWTLLGDNINGEAADDESGRSVSLSYNGYKVAIGAPQINTSGDNPGYVSVYEYDTNTAAWNKLGNNIEGKDNGDYSGSSVSLSSDGYIVAIGSPQNNTGNDVDGTNPGYVSVYEYDSNTAAWTQLGDDIIGEGEGDYSGYSVSLSSDGYTVAIGAPYNDNDNGDNSGHVKVYEYDSNTAEWTQIGNNIDGEAADDESGNAVSLSRVGITLAIGAQMHNSDRGHVRVYEYIECIGGGKITGDVTGNLTGDVTGNLTGDVTGNLTGNVTGDLTGNVTGDLTGNVTGDITGNVTGELTGDVTGNLTGDVTATDITATTMSSETFSVNYTGNIQLNHYYYNATTNYIQRTVHPDNKGPDNGLAYFLSFNYDLPSSYDTTDDSAGPGNGKNYYIGLHKRIAVGSLTESTDTSLTRYGIANGITSDIYVLYGNITSETTLNNAPAYNFIEDNKYVVSDMRLKDVIGSFDALDKIKNLNLVKYKYNDDCRECMCCRFKDNNIAIDGSTESTNELHQDIETSVQSQCDKEYYGIIAQEVKDDFPDVIGYSSVKVPDTENEYYYTVSYTNFIPHLLKSVQELTALVEDLKTENATMKARLDVLENPTT